MDDLINLIIGYFIVGGIMYCVGKRSMNLNDVLGMVTGVALLLIVKKINRGD